MFQLQVYNLYGADSVVMNVFLLLVAGLLVNGPYALITTAVSAELGTHHTLQGNSKALATVTAIIDGTGSIGKKLFYCLLLLRCQKLNVYNNGNISD